MRCNLSLIFIYLFLLHFLLNYIVIPLIYYIFLSFLLLPFLYSILFIV